MSIPHLMQLSKLHFPDTSMPSDVRLKKLQFFGRTALHMLPMLDGSLQFCIYPAVSGEKT